MVVSPLLGIKSANEEWQILNVDRLEKEVIFLQSTEKGILLLVAH